MFYFAICDDEISCCETEKEMITDYFAQRHLDVTVDIFTNGEEVMGLGERVTEYDAFFLDVSMEQVSGMTLANWIRAQSEDVMLVFVSGYLSYVFDGYKVGAVRYLLKDETQFAAALEECLSHIVSKRQEKQGDCITGFADKKMQIPADKILYVESRLHKVIFYIIESDGTLTDYSKYGKLDDVTHQLAPFGFCRTHQSYLVNMNFAENVKRYAVTLQGGLQINISKKYYKETEAKFIRMQGEF